MSVPVALTRAVSAGGLGRMRAVPGIEFAFDGSACPPLTAEPGEDSGCRHVPWAEVLPRTEVLLGLPCCGPATLAGIREAAPRLRWVQGLSAGFGEQLAGMGDPEDLDGVAVTSASGVLAVPLAEHVMAGVLALVRDLAGVRADQRRHQWRRRSFEEMDGATLAVLGLGALGRRVAVLAKAFGMRVVAVRRAAGGAVPDGVDAVAPVDELADVLAGADVVVVALPLTPRTRNLVSREVIDRLSPRCVVVNVGRGGVVDEEALAAAAGARRIRGAVLDVFATEPLPAASRLWDLDNVIVTAHTAGLTDRLEERMVDLLVDNLQRYVAGDPLRNPVDLRRGY